MKKTFQITGVLLVVIVVFVLTQCIYIVQPDELATVHRFGEIVPAVVTEGNSKFVKAGNSEYTGLQNVKVIDERGLLFKIPFIDEVQKYSSKYLTYTSRQETINTSDKRKLDVQMYAQYSIENPAIYRIKVGSMTRLNQLMDDNVYPVVIQSDNKSTFDQFFNDVRLSLGNIHLVS